MSIDDLQSLPECIIERTKVLFALKHFWVDWENIFDKLSRDTKDSILWIVSESQDGWFLIVDSTEVRNRIAAVLYFNDI